MILFMPIDAEPMKNTVLAGVAIPGVASDLSERGNDWAIRRRSATVAVTTHFGTIGLLQERGIVTDVDDMVDGKASAFTYRPSADVMLRLDFPMPVKVNVGDLVIVKSLTMPDGAVLPVSARLPSMPGWTSIQDVSTMLRPYSQGATRVTRWSAGTGSAMGLAALLGLAAPVSAIGAVTAAALAFGMRQRDRRDHARIEKLLA
jgi:hypothetical protein